MHLVRLTCLVVFASVSLHNPLAHAAPRDEILIYQGPPDPDIAIHFFHNPSGWKGPRPGNPVTPKPGDVFFVIHDDDSSITFGTLDGYISPSFPKGDWLRDFARMPTENDPGAKQARDRILPGQAQTAAKAGSGPTGEGAGATASAEPKTMTLDELRKFFDEQVKAYGAIAPLDNEPESRKLSKTPEAYEGKVVALPGRFNRWHTTTEFAHRGSLLFFDKPAMWLLSPTGDPPLEFHARGMAPSSKANEFGDVAFLIGVWERGKKADPGLSVDDTSWGINTYLFCGVVVYEKSKKAEVLCETLKKP